MQLLVYGTLKQGKPNHARFGMDKQKFLGKETVRGCSLVQPAYSQFPYCIQDSEGQVICELYEIDDSTLRLLDAVEKGAGYKRVEVELDDGSKASIYVEASDNTYPKLKRFEEF